MAKSQDYVALEWVSGEIVATLKQAKQALEAYVQNPQDTSQLRFCLTYIHQVYGTLKMVEFTGAILFASELEALAQSLVDESLAMPRDGLVALMGGLLQLPPYLQRLKISHSDSPSALLPSINDMRMVRAAPPLDAFDFFKPNLTHLKLSADSPRQLSEVEFIALVEKLKQMFQIAFVGIVRDKKLGKNLQYLAKICQRLRLMSLGKSREAMWLIALGLIEGIANRSIAPASGVKSLLRQIDSELKGLVAQGPSYMEGAPDDLLLRQFLYHIAKAENDTPLMAELKKNYQLEAALPKSYDDFVAAPDYDAVATVIDALLEELAAVKDFLDLYVRSENTSLDVLRPAQPMLKRVADTMSLLGFKEPLETIREQLNILTDYINDGSNEVEVERLQEMASYVISVESSLQQYLTTNGDSVHKTEAQLHFDRATEVVIGEVCSLLEQVKESIVDFVADQFNRDHLRQVPSMLVAASGALRLSALDRAAAVIRACGHYTTEHLLSDKQAQWQQLDTLADVISSIDYYLERLLEDFDGVDNSAIIEVAEESLVTLGYLFDGDYITIPEPVQEQTEIVGGDGAFERVDIARASPLVSHDAVAASVGPLVVDENDDVDPEIIGIFVEEAAEVLAVINQWLPLWLTGIRSEESLSEVRRAFHTLKGSGRMVGAEMVGELAWSIEQMLNRVIDKAVELDAERVAWISHVTLCFPAMVEFFERGKSVNESFIAELVAVSTELSSMDTCVDIAIYPVDRLTTIVEPVVATSRDIEDGEESDAIDAEAAILLEVFEQEARTHLETIYSYISEALESVDPRYITDSLQRALHTLKGSAHMADVTSIARIVGPAEKLVKGMQASRVRAPSSVLSVLQMTTNLVEQGLQLLPEHCHADIDGTDELLFDIAELTDHILTDPHLNGIDDDAIDPELVNQLLTEGMDKLADVEGILDTQPLSVEAVATIATLLLEFNQIVDSIPLPLMHELIVVTVEACERVNEENIVSFSQYSGRAIDTVIGMMDCIAASMDIASADDLVREIQSWCDQQSAVLLSRQDGRDDAGFEVAEDISDKELVASAVEIAESSLVVELRQEVVVNVELTSTFEGGFTAGDEYLELEAEVVSAEPEVVAKSPLLQEAVERAEIKVSPYFDDDDIDDEIIEIFIEEAADLLESIDDILQAWGRDIAHAQAMPELLRLLHTFKGGARLSRVDELGDLSHDFETYVVSVESSNHLAETVLAEFQRHQDSLHQGMDRLLSQRNSTAEVVASVNDKVAAEALVALAAADHFAAENLPEQSSSVEVLGPSVDFEGVLSAESKRDIAVSPSIIEAERLAAEALPVEFSSGQSSLRMVALPRSRREVDGTDTILPLSPEGLNQVKAAQEVIKVPAQLLEDLVNLAGETTIARGRIEEQVSDISYAIGDMESTIDRLQDQLRRLDSETEAQILFRQEQMESSGMEEFDPLEMDRYTALQQLSRSLIESASDITDIKGTISDKARDIETLLLQQSRVNTDLQEGLMRSRMVPFSRMVPRLRRIVRQVSSELGKKVNFVLENTEGEMDRIVLEKMVAPLEHMLRNAIDHGIESSQQRLAAGKSEQGNIVISMAREGGEVVIQLEDDGGGIDLEAVREKAIDSGLMTVDSELGDHEVMQFILQAGFSTAASVTQISGRGVGMDVAHSEIKQLGGIVEISSNNGTGTRFTVRLPFTVSVNRALMVKVGGDTYAIPLNTIEGVVRVSPFELEAYYQPEAPLFEYAGQPYSLRYMGALLQSQATPNLASQTIPLPVVLVRGSDHAVAVQVDALLGSREIVVKNLGPQFSRVQGLTGATVLGDGSVVVILDLMAMIRADISQAYSLAEIDDNIAEQSNKLTIMVIDDSVTVRKVTSRFLERNGMNVLLAKDGADAMQLLIDHRPDVMLLDIEMPRMDGFEVASRVKHSERLRDIPIIMITSRTGDKHRERAFSLGVDRYLGKPYQEAQLLDTLAELVVLPE